MKRFIKSMLGVTLLEIMLVLAIAAMIIVMSVRYYQSATGSQQVNVALQQVQGYIAAADSLSVGSGSYTKVTASAVTGVVGTLNAGPPAKLTSFTGQATNFQLELTFVPAGLCPAVLAQLKSSYPTKITPADAKCADGVVTITYTPTA